MVSKLNCCHSIQFKTLSGDFLAKNVFLQHTRQSKTKANKKNFRSANQSDAAFKDLFYQFCFRYAKHVSA